MIDCKKCQKTSCAKQVAKQNLTILFCTGYKKKMEQLSTVQNQSKRKIKKKEKQA